MEARFALLAVIGSNGNQGITHERDLSMVRSATAGLPPAPGGVRCQKFMRQVLESLVILDVGKHCGFRLEAIDPYAVKDVGRCASTASGGTRQVV